MAPLLMVMAWLGGLDEGHPKIYCSFSTSSIRRYVRRWRDRSRATYLLTCRGCVFTGD